MNTNETSPWLDLVRQKIEAIRFGSVQVVVHEGRVTLLESTDKVRLTGEPQFQTARP